MYASRCTVVIVTTAHLPPTKTCAGVGGNSTVGHPQSKCKSPPAGEVEMESEGGAAAESNSAMPFFSNIGTVSGGIVVNNSNEYSQNVDKSKDNQCWEVILF